MKITAEKLLTIGDSRVLNDLAEQKLPALGAYRLSRLSAVVLPECARIQQARNALLTPETAVEISPGTWQLRPECMEAFSAAITPLLSEEIEINSKPLTLADLAGASISANAIAALGCLLEE